VRMLVRELLIVFSLVLGAHAQQRNRPAPFKDDFDLSAVSRGWKSVGEFPFPRGEVPVFHFDQGDEGFINTIPGLIEGLDKIGRVVNNQNKITKVFGEAFDQCEACG